MCVCNCISEQEKQMCFVGKEGCWTKGLLLCLIVVQNWRGSEKGIGWEAVCLAVWVYKVTYSHLCNWAVIFTVSIDQLTLVGVRQSISVSGVSHSLFTFSLFLGWGLAQHYILSSFTVGKPNSASSPLHEWSFKWRQSMLGPCVSSGAPDRSLGNLKSKEN